jgi:hypothetical protein
MRDEDDPNVTNKKLPGNPTQSYRTRHPLRVVGEMDSWKGHDPEVLKGMLDHLALLREQGLDVIEDWASWAGGSIPTSLSAAWSVGSTCIRPGSRGCRPPSGATAEARHLR